MGETGPVSGGRDGLLLLDKPEGPTSHELVQAVRRNVGVRRVGHTGTLDPFASGLLLLCVGRATRLVEYFHMLPKTYRGVAVLGVRTDTDDRTGRVVETSEAWRDLTLSDVRDAARQLVGDHDQLPPAFSAKKVRGRRAYEMARAGAEVELATAAVSVHRLAVTNVCGAKVGFDAEVSTGTYVRALARDLGEYLGCHAHLAELRRESVGPFGVADAVSPDEIDTREWPPRGWLVPAAALAWLPCRQLSSEEVERIEVGQPIPVVEDRLRTDLPVPLLLRERLVAVARYVGGELRPEKVFPRE